MGNFVIEGRVPIDGAVNIVQRLEHGWGAEKTTWKAMQELAEEVRNVVDTVPDMSGQLSEGGGRNDGLVIVLLQLLLIVVI